MYLEFFGMRELPFTLTPNTDFFLDLNGHRRALEVVQHALENGEGFVKVTGEVGVGKTLLCRRLLNTLGDHYVTAYIPNPFLSPDSLMMAFAEELDISIERNLGSHHVLRQINNKLIAIKASGRQVVFLLDEAQALPEASIEALSLLTSLKAENKKLLQVVLFGQQELNDLLNKDSLKPLKQRVSFSHTLPVLNVDEVHSYINHRLSRSGFPGINLFDQKAMLEIYKATRGIPRLINILAHKALIIAFGRGDTKINCRHVQRAVEDSEDARINKYFGSANNNEPNWLTIFLSGSAASALTLLVVYLI